MSTRHVFRKVNNCARPHPAHTTDKHMTKMNWFVRQMCGSFWKMRNRNSNRNPSVFQPTNGQMIQNIIEIDTFHTLCSSTHNYNLSWYLSRQPPVSLVPLTVSITMATESSLFHTFWIGIVIYVRRFDQIDLVRCECSSLIMRFFDDSPDESRFCFLLLMVAD